MIVIEFIDGSTREYQSPVTGVEIAKDISISLQKQALLMLVNDQICDIEDTITQSAKVKIITKKDKELVVPVMRHDLAHILAEALCELYPDITLTIGPVIDYGFYYDISSARTISVKDLPAIEKKMQEIIQRNEKIIKITMPRSEAIEFYKKQDNKFKVEILSQISDDTVTLYKQGEFIDLCRGPHLRSTKDSSVHFKLTKVSAAYWRADVNQDSLQRIYGIAFAEKKDLDDHLYMLEEAERRDHRKLGKSMKLFHVQQEAAGSIFWHENGTYIYNALQSYIRDKLLNNGYFEVKTPQLVSRELWEKSGHWEKFLDNIYICEDSHEVFALKPMNCPCHIEIFKQGLVSYKDLPVRMMEFGSCHRRESSGSLHGIMRVRSFVQDDAHIFCTFDQIVEETKKFCELLKVVYKDIFGDVDILVYFSDRPEKRAGSDEVWDMAEQALHDAAIDSGLELKTNKGEGAFYGPKLEFTLKDSLNRLWQLGTLQVDMIIPKRLGASFINHEGNKETPVLLHRAILGSFERFIGILLEHYAGRLPLWLAPQQVVVATVTQDEKVKEYAEGCYNQLRELGIRAHLDVRHEKISYKVREHSEAKVPIIMVIGFQERDNSSVSLRFLGSSDTLIKGWDECLSLITQHIKNKAIDLDFS